MSIDYYRERLGDAQERLGAFHERVFPGKPLDHGMLQLEQVQRGGNIDAQLDEWKRLNSSITYWRRKLRAVETREATQEVREQKARQHEVADLKAVYGHCTEVLWSLSGRWHPVKRWNRKSGTVAGLDETIPHTQVAGAR